ncbi:MAG TPA: efflux RND transporter periplasmic adaptor subunit [Puia sp.]|nr:efflux RND transporter periplasmic adaptor subunit [Puia sp.]
MKMKTTIYTFVLLILFTACNNTVRKEIKSASGSIGNIPLETLLKPTDEYVIAALPVTTPLLKNIKIPVNAYGTIEYDTRAATTISARVSGRIEKMYIRYRYQPVEKGQKIMDVYSPEILTAEQNLLFLLQNDAGNTSFIQAAKEKLLLLGMSAGQLEQVIKSGKPLYSISIYSNSSGHVHEAGMEHDGGSSINKSTEPAVSQELSLKEGMYIQKGQTLLMLMDHHKVWAALQIFTSDQSLVKIGNPVMIIPEADTSKVITGKIDFFEPFYRTNSKTLTARVYFHNHSMLPVGSHVSANIFSDPHNAWWLPASAVISLGMNEVAFIKSSGGFIAHKIITGIRSDNLIQVTSGINEKDTVAVNAQYFIDSESFIRTSSK